MPAIEVQEQKDRAPDKIKDQIHNVALEVEKSRTEMARMETRLVERIGEVEKEMGKTEVRLSGQIGELDSRLSGQIGELDVRLSGQIGDVEKRLSEQMAGQKEHLEKLLLGQFRDLEKSLRGWLALGISLMAAVAALMAILV